MKKKRFEDLALGESSWFEKTITDADIFAFCGICGDFNPLHVSETFAQATRFNTRIAHGMLSASLIDPTLTEIVGAGGIHVSQSIIFTAPVKVGDTIRVESTITEKIPEKRGLKIESVLTNQDGTIVITGTASVRVPE
ncbi:MAG: MaoC family dehydratase [Desulfomonilia bacterium]